MKNAQIVQIEKIKLLFVLNGEIQKKSKTHFTQDYLFKYMKLIFPYTFEYLDIQESFKYITLPLQIYIE